MSSKEYREKHREELREKAREYYAKHKEEIRIKDKIRYKKERTRRLKTAKENVARRREEVRQYQKEYRAKHRQELSAYSRAIWQNRKSKYGGAHHALNHAIASGAIRKQPCEICGEIEVEAHHDDYNKPLVVRWLCERCHSEWHKNNKPKYVGE